MNDSSRRNFLSYLAAMIATGTIPGSIGQALASTAADADDQHADVDHF